MSFVVSPPGADPIVVRAHFSVSPARLFAAWTEPEIVEQWFGSDPGNLASAAIDLRPGGHWRFIETERGHAWTGFEGRYVEIIPGRLLVFTWAKTVASDNGDTRTTPTSEVEIRMAEAGEGTDMTITHSSLDSESRTEFRFGWDAGTSSLVELLR